MIIGLTGTISSGKGAAADILKGKGYTYFSLSSEVREEATARSIEHTRENLQNLGNKMREDYGVNVLATRVAKKVREGNYNNVVIDGIRNPAEVNELKQLPYFTLLAVDAPSNLRFERVLSRNRESDPKTLEAFIKVDERDRGIYEKDSGQQVEKCMGMARYHIINDGNLEKLAKELNTALSQLEAELR